MASIGSILLISISVLCVGDAAKQHLQGIFMHGGDCKVSQIYRPYINGGGQAEVVKTQLTSYFSSAAASFGGNVYIFGGSPYLNGASPVKDTQIFDPLTNMTRKGAPMQIERVMHTATAYGPYILVCGGMDRTFTNIPQCEAYDPVMDEWTFWTNNMSNPVHSHGAAVLKQPANIAVNNVRVFDSIYYVFGGYDSTLKPTAEVYAGKYDKMFDYLNKVTPMMMPRADFSSALIANHLLACGGWSKNGDMKTNIKISSSCEVFDPLTMAWSEYHDMTAPRQYQAIVSWTYPEFEPFSDTYILGGFNQFLKTSQNTVDRYTSRGAQGMNLNMSKPCSSMIAVPVGEGSACGPVGAVSFRKAERDDLW